MVWLKENEAEKSKRERDRDRERERERRNARRMGAKYFSGNYALSLRRGSTSGPI